MDTPSWTCPNFPTPDRQHSCSLTVMKDTSMSIGSDRTVFTVSLCRFLSVASLFVKNGQLPPCEVPDGWFLSLGLWAAEQAFLAGFLFFRSRHFSLMSAEVFSFDTLSFKHKALREARVTSDKLSANRVFLNSPKHLHRQNSEEMRDY